MSDDFIIQNHNDVDPSPIAPRKCRCGCGHTFQPKSEKNIFINKKHADRYHYHKVKKPKNKNQNEIEKIHRKNDRICAKYVKANDGNPVECYWESILADGFNHNYIQGSDVIEDVKWVFTYNHMYTIYRKKNILKIKIQKR